MAEPADLGGIDRNREALLDILMRHRVAFVLIGGAAIQSHDQLDLAFAPTGFPDGYRDLAPRATQRPVAGTTIVVPVAALEDVHESKRQADRPKDREYLRQAEMQ